MPTSRIVGISGSGIYFPKKKVAVKDLATKHGVDYKTIFSDHGIRYVHLASSREGEFFMARESVKAAIKDAGLNPEDIDLVIYCRGITKQKAARPLSSGIIEQLNIVNAYGFDIDAGFIGGLVGIQVAGDIVKKNYYMDNAIVVGSQDFDELYLFGGNASRIRNMVFGDGAATVVISDDALKNNILASNFVIDHYTSFIDDLLVRSYSEKYAVTRALKKIKTLPIVKKIRDSHIHSNLAKRWVNNAYNAINFSIRSVNLDISDISHFVKTQLSLQETELFGKKLKVDKEKIYNASTEKGHLGHADILYNLHAALGRKDLVNMDIIALVAANYDCSSGALIIRK